MTAAAIRTVHLHGEAGELFGKTFRLAVRSLAEATRLIACQSPGFRRYLIRNEFKVMLRNDRGTLHLDERLIDFSLPQGELHVVPRIQGAKSSGVGKLIAGLVIAAVAWYAAPALSATLVGGITYGNVALLGVGLAFAGISQLLTKKQNAPQDEQSFVLNGGQNVIQQGGSVPQIYGETRIGSVVVSQQYYSYDIGEGYIAGSSVDRLNPSP